MTLIAIILAMIAGRFIGDEDKAPSFVWFESLTHWLEKHLSAYRIWDSSAGIVITVGIPVLILIVLMHVLETIFWLLPALLSVIVLYLCLGYESLDRGIERYADALAEGSDEELDEASARLLEHDISKNVSDDFHGIIESIFRQSNDRIFAVLFWFIVLGPIGALLYRLVYEVLQKRHDIHGPYTDSTRDLYAILNWPTLRLTLLGYALVGSLIHTIEVWREKDDLSLHTPEALITEGGIAAINCDVDDDDSENQEYSLEHASGLITRSIILWLVLIALSTISGWVA